MAEQIIVTGYFDEKSPGFVRASGGGTTRYLRSDGTWATIGSVPDLADGSVPISKLAPIAANTLLGNSLGVTGPVTALSASAARQALGLPPVSWQLATKTADTTFTTTTLTDVPVGISGAPYMGWTLQTLHTYHFRYVTLVRSTATNIGIGLAVSTPSAAAFGAYGMMVGQTSAGPSSAMLEPITASNVPAISSGVADANTDYVFIVEGVITPNAVGDLRLRARIETGVATVTVLAGSFGILMDRAL